jgi:hypothetical protein
VVGFWLSAPATRQRRCRFGWRERMTQIKAEIKDFVISVNVLEN